MATEFVYTYNTADDPKRRIVAGIARTKKGAMEALVELKKNLGDFMVDKEINEVPVRD